jgi:RNA polymerase sigma factor (sigma-70 family)
MSEDTLLLRRFAESRDEAAFALLVEHHLSLVHSAALRQLNGDLHLARDVAQLVFTDLARKAGSLDASVPLAGWLFQATRFAAAKLIRSEQRRRAREEAAHTMNDDNNDDEQTRMWEHLRPLLDETMARLGDKDRLAVLLRYFEGRSYADIGQALSTSENSARMRTDRALGETPGAARPPRRDQLRHRTLRRARR